MAEHQTFFLTFEGGQENTSRALEAGQAATTSEQRRGALQEILADFNGKADPPPVKLGDRFAVDMDTLHVMRGIDVSRLIETIRETFEGVTIESEDTGTV